MFLESQAQKLILMVQHDVRFFLEKLHRGILTILHEEDQTFLVILREMISIWDSNIDLTRANHELLYDCIEGAILNTGARFKSYTSDNSEKQTYVCQLEEILDTTSKKRILLNSEFHLNSSLEWQAIHRITSILHSMQHA
jgi:hypothetical protein